MLKSPKSFALAVVATIGCLAIAAPSWANHNSINNLEITGTIQPEICGSATSQLPPARTPFLINVGDAGLGGLHMTFNNAQLGVLQGEITASDLADLGITGFVTFTGGTTANIPHVQGLSCTPNTATSKTGAGASAHLTIDLTQQGYPAGSTITAIDFGVFNQNNPYNISVSIDQPTYTAVSLVKVPTAFSCNF